MPFPYITAAPTAANGENDFDNAQVSRLTLDRAVGRCAERVAGHRQQRRVPALLLELPRDVEEGFERDILFTNEETPDYVNRQEDSWPPVPAARPEREAGVVVALDVRSGKHRPIYGMGRYNHENAVAVPGFHEPGRPLRRRHVHERSADRRHSRPAKCRPSRRSTRTSPAARDALLADKGDLYAFVSDTPGVKNYYDVATRVGHGGQRATSSRCPKEHRDRAKPGRLRDQGRRHGLSRRRPRTAAGRPISGRPIPLGIDGPQWVLEYWSDTHNVFQFVRIEDIAYDKRRGHGERRLPRRLRVVVGPPPRARQRSSGRPTAGSGRWCSTARTRRRSPR